MVQYEPPIVQLRHIKCKALEIPHLYYNLLLAMSADPPSSPIPRHPRYYFADGDIFVITTDIIEFRVHSAMMKANSTYFQDIAPPGAVIATNSTVFEFLLDHIYQTSSYSPPKPHCFREASQFIQIAEYFGMPQVIANLRSILLEEKMYRGFPLEVYIFACKRQWWDVAEVASTETLQLDLSEDECLDKLKELDAANICKLLKLHSRRKRQIVDCVTLNKDELEDRSTEHSSALGEASGVDTEDLQEIITKRFSDAEKAAVEFVTEAYQFLQEYISGSLSRRPLGDQLTPDAFSSATFDFARNVTCPHCDVKAFDLESIAAEISRMSNEEAVRSIRDIED